jgi:hypothetical protein
VCGVVCRQFWLYHYIPFPLVFFLLAALSLLPSCVIIANAVVRGKVSTHLTVPLVKG